jgi:hypothetical protein
MGKGFLEGMDDTYTQFYHNVYDFRREVGWGGKIFKQNGKLSKNLLHHSFFDFSLSF